MEQPDEKKDVRGMPCDMSQWASRPPLAAVSLTNDQLRENLNATKGHIDAFRQEELGHVFNLATHMVNPCELVSKVAAVPAVSRAHYKMLEIANLFELFPLAPTPDGKPPVAALMCEAPGGFAECIYERNSTGAGATRRCAAQITVLTLIPPHDRGEVAPRRVDPTRDISMNPKMKPFLFRGGDGTGDILKLANVEAFIDHVSTISQGNMAALVTADGGIEVADHNNQENASMRLICSEILTAIFLLSKGGAFVLKLFDTFSEDTERLLYVLTLLFDETSMYKPLSSRVCNSERYVVCLGFCGVNNEDAETMKILTALESGVATGCMLDLAETVKVPNNFKFNLRRYNHKFVSYQIARLEEAIALVSQMRDRDKTEKEHVRHLRQIFESDPQARERAAAFCEGLDIPCVVDNE